MIFEVATGFEFKLSKSRIFSKPPTGHHSVKGVGKMSPLNTMEYKGAIAYTGTPVENEDELSILKTGKSKLAYNEYVVYDNSQIRPIFLVKVNFIFK